MNASKLTNGSEAEVLDMTSQTSPKGCSEECGAGCGQKGQQESYWTKDQDKTSSGESNQKLHFGETCLPLLRERRLGFQLHQASGSPLSQMFQQALWIDGAGWEDEDQEVDLLKSITGAGLEGSSAPQRSQENEPFAVERKD